MTKPAFKLFIPPYVLSYLRKLHPQIKKNIKNALKDLANSPYNGKVLLDELDGYLRYKVDRFRIVYKISRKTVDIVAIGPRQTIYTETLYLLKHKKKQ